MRNLTAPNQGRAPNSFGVENPDRVLMKSRPGFRRLLDLAHGVSVDVDNISAVVNGRDEVSADSMRMFRQILTMELYAAFHAASPQLEDIHTRTSFREPHTEELLSSAVPHDYTHSGGLLVRWEGSAAIVNFPEAMIAVPRSEIIDSEPQIGELIVVRIPSRRPALSHGFFMIDGPTALSDHSRPAVTGVGTRRFYIHTASPEASGDAWSATLPALNSSEIPYRSKALSHRWGYPRRDAVVFYVSQEHEANAESVLRDQLADRNFVQPEISMFAHFVAPGLGAADDPRDSRPGYGELSFGEHRSGALASAAIAAAQGGSGNLDDFLLDALLAASIDPTDPSRNLAVKTKDDA